MVDDYDESVRARAAWAEAAALVQADVDAEIHDEARGLVVAEMADVRMDERLAALGPGQRTHLVLTNGESCEGDLEELGRDLIVLARPTEVVVVPLSAIAVIDSAPRVMHEESADGPRGASWRYTLRNFLGAWVSASVGATRVSGQLTWVGHDHIDVAVEGSRLSVMWQAVSAVSIPNSRR